jgi:sugar phosphate isomerase/epimerase
MEAAKREGSGICHENVCRCAGYNPDFFADMARALPDAGFVIDLKQAIRAGQDIYQMADAMAGRLRHVHFSDSDASRDCLPPGKGTFNIGKFFSTIVKNGFDGGVIVELYRENFVDFVELYTSYQLLLTEVSTERKVADSFDAIRQS